MATPAHEAPQGAWQVAPRHAIRDFFRNPPRAAYRLSDDGATLGFMQPAGDAGRMNIFVQALTGSTLAGEARQLTHETARDLAAYFFKGNQYLRYDIAADKVDAGYPKPIAGNWPGFWPGGLDA